MSDNNKPVFPDMNGQCHVGVHFGKLVEVYANPIQIGAWFTNPKMRR
jgi:hypothetical protein